MQKEHKLFEDAKCSYIHTAIDQKDPTEDHSMYNWSLREGALADRKSELKDLLYASHPTSNVSMTESSLADEKIYLKDLVDASYPTSRFL